jgi:hypothetical protein
MRYISVLTADNAAAAELPPQGKLLEDMARFMQEITSVKALLLCDTRELARTGARVRLSSGKFTITAGSADFSAADAAPCAMFEVDSILEAVEWTASFLKVLGEGECEIRPL